MVKIYQQPFAHAGTKQVIPDASDPQGFVSNEDGFTTDYELPDADPNYKPIERAEFNGLMNTITEALGEIQQFGFAKWQAVGGGWPQGANVNHGGGVWQSLSNANTEEPGAGALWKPIVFDDIGQTTETDLGLVRLATTAEAQALTDDAKALTPAKLAAVLDATAYGRNVAWVDETANRASGVTYTNTNSFPLSIIFAAQCTSAGQSPTFYVDGVQVAYQASYAAVQIWLQAIVPVGSTYQGQASTGASMVKFLELK